jgi:hypothetical protein
VLLLVVLLLLLVLLVLVLELLLGQRSGVPGSPARDGVVDGAGGLLRWLPLTLALAASVSAQGSAARGGGGGIVLLHLCCGAKRRRLSGAGAGAGQRCCKGCERTTTSCRKSEERRWRREAVGERAANERKIVPENPAGCD